MTLPIEVFIPNFLNPFEYIAIDNNKKTTLKNLKWDIAFIDTKNSTPENIKVIWRQNYIIQFCKVCKQQRHFIITSCLPKQSKNGNFYISGFYGYCTFCKEELN